jgi:hypothetical protein
MMNKRTLLACLLVLSASICIFTDQAQAAPADIPQEEITSLQQKFAEINSQKSTAKKRRSCKSIVRKGNSLIDGAPTAPNRFEILSIMLQSQKLLLGMDNSERNRESLFEICGRLAKAPNTYASLRLDAELLFSTMKLDAKGAGKEERVEALTALVARYRDTPTEAKCLMIASMIARKIESRELEQDIVTMMTERFATDPTVIKFRLRNLGFGRTDVPFSGNFKRADGATLSFPVDQLGHASVVVFWSKQMPGYQEELKKIHEKAIVYADRLSVFSFNADELPDAGEKQLRSLGLDWTAVHLPDGKKSRLFRIFGDTKPFGYLLNPHGYTLLMSRLAKHGNVHGNLIDAQTAVMVSDKLMPHARSTAQLQSVFAGDFLVIDSGKNPARTADSVPQEQLDAIQACFTPAPMRYRLSPAQALAGYTKAENLCRETISQSPKAPDLWRVRNQRIIALLGMWKTAIEPKHLDAAVAEARTTLATTLPKGADVVPQFCLTISALRQDGVDAKSTLAAFIKATGGDDAPATAYACASILALDAHSRDLHQQYRQKLLTMHAEDDATLWPVVSFLRERYHRFSILRALDIRRSRKESRGNVINHGWSTSTTPFPASELKTLDGGALNLPKDTEGKLTLILFIEPPADPAAEIPLEMTGKPAEGKKREIQGTIRYASQLANDHIYKDLNVVVAFLSDDTDRIKALAKTHKWTCQLAMVPGGLNNPLVRQLGILSADHIANVFLLRRDGTIAWQTTGLRQKFEFSHRFSAFLGMTVHIEQCDIALAYKALEQGDYKKAAHLFAGPFPKKRDERFRWTAPRFHGRALANMKLKQWDAALEDIDKALADHDPKRFRHDEDHPCGPRVEMLTLRAITLENLGRTTEAVAARKLATPSPTPYRTSIYTEFHGKLKELRLKAGNP